MPSPVALPDRPRWRRRRGRRPSPRHDATPFVDLAFVLLAAYVLVMLLGQPAEMELNQAAECTHLDCDFGVRTVQLRATKDGALWWGRYEQVPVRLTHAALQDSLRQTGRDGLTVTVLKVERGAPYRTAIDLLDEFDELNVERFAVTPMRPRDLALIAEARAVR